MITLLYMTAKLSRAAGLNGPHGQQMPSRHVMAVSLPIPGTVAAKDIHPLKRTLHKKPPSLGTNLYEINGTFYLALTFPRNVEINRGSASRPVAKEILDIVEIRP